MHEAWIYASERWAQSRSGHLPTACWWALQHVRAVQKKKRRPVPDSEIVEGACVAPEADALELHDFLERLAEDARAVAVLLMEGRTLTEIAEIRGIHRATVSRVVARIRVLALAYWEEEG